MGELDTKKGDKVGTLAWPAYGFAANGPLSLCVEISRAGIGGEVAETAEEIGRKLSLEKNALPKKQGFMLLKGVSKSFVAGWDCGGDVYIGAEGLREDWYCTGSCDRWGEGKSAQNLVQYAL